MTSMQYFLVFLVVAVYILALLVGGGILLHKPKRRPHYGFSAPPEDTHTGDDARPTLHGDGVRDDTPAFDAIVNGRPYINRRGDLSVTVRTGDNVYRWYDNQIDAYLSEQIRRRLDGGDGA